MKTSLFEHFPKTYIHLQYLIRERACHVSWSDYPNNMLGKKTTVAAFQIISRANCIFEFRSRFKYRKRNLVNWSILHLTNWKDFEAIILEYFVMGKGQAWPRCLSRKTKFCQPIIKKTCAINIYLRYVYNS